jgi:hypothetical protein
LLFKIGSGFGLQPPGLNGGALVNGESPLVGKEALFNPVTTI